MITTGIALYLCYEVYMHVVFGPPEDLEETTSNKGGQEADDGTVEAYMYFTLPFSTQKVAPPPYRGSDPEWKMFARFSRDKELQKSVRHSLGEQVRKAALNSPWVVQRYGKNLRVQKTWLDFHFPYYPFPTYQKKV
jgi:hypothetical protein